MLSAVVIAVMPAANGYSLGSSAVVTSSSPKAASRKARVVRARTLWPEQVMPGTEVVFFDRPLKCRWSMGRSFDSGLLGAYLLLRHRQHTTGGEVTCQGLQDEIDTPPRGVFVPSTPRARLTPGPLGVFDTRCVFIPCPGCVAGQCLIRPLSLPVLHPPPTAVTAVWP